MRVYSISAVTLKVKDMEKSCQFYSRLPGFTLGFGGAPTDAFTTFEVGKGSRIYINLELIGSDRNSPNEITSSSNHDSHNLTFNESSRSSRTKGCQREDFGRIIFHTDNVHRLYLYMKNDEFISGAAIFETEPADAPWGERFFHIREPNGYQLSFAQLLKESKDH